MRLAFLSSLVPEAEPRSGFAIANRAVVDGLRELGHEVMSIGMRQTADEQPLEGSSILGTLNIENAKAPFHQKVGWASRSFWAGLPFASAKLRAIPSEAIDRAIADARPDALVVNSYQLATAFPTALELPYVYLAHNVEAQTASANAKSSGGFERLMYVRDARLLARVERDLIAGSRHVWCLAEDDRRSFDLSSERCSLLPLLLPTASPIPNVESKPFDVVLIGTWTWSANAVGLGWLVRYVVPLLPVDMKIAVAGTVPADIDLSDQRLVAMGRVDSADGFLAQGHVVALIARGGTGVQLKTIESFQRGLPTVATASAVRGIASKPENCVVADDPQTFAKALIDAARNGREEQDLRVDPVAWVERQRAGLLDGLRRGVETLG